MTHIVCMIYYDNHLLNPLEHNIQIALIARASIQYMHTCSPKILAHCLLLPLTQSLKYISNVCCGQLSFVFSILWQVRFIML